NFIPEYGKLVLVRSDVIPNLADLANQTGLTGRIAYASDYGLSRSLINGNNHNFAPRVGLAWRPFGGTRTVIRSGYGIFYASAAENHVRNDLGNTFPFAVSQTFQRNTKSPGKLTLNNPFPDAMAKFDGVNNTAGYELNAPAQYLQSWNFTIEHEVLSSIALEMAYVGSKGTHLGRRFNYNQPYRSPEYQLPEGGFLKPFQEFNQLNYYSFGANSSYNAAMFTLRKRFTRSTFFRLNYVFSKSIDDASQMFGAGDGGDGGAQDARNLGLERGRSDWDNRHALTMSFVSDIPVFGRNRFLSGWQFAGSGRLYSGQPFTPKISNAQLDQGEASRPDRIAKGTLPNPNPDNWFDVSAFPVVPLGAYRFGNSGRNILDGPGYVSFNFSLMKKFRIRERDNVQCRWEVFNSLNHPNLRLPENAVNAINVGTITAADPGRTMQIALKYIF
ncbi:MAG: hypothetical protein M1541_05185, partial [Acidobacteria bacterium]|nr:hypothetical protein [Acidobacteriota bacterium]